MNSDITTNTLKLSSMTLVKTDKPSEAFFPGNRKEIGQNDSAIKPLNSTEDKSNKDTQLPSVDLVKKAADNGNKFLQATNLSLQFKVDDSTKEVVVKIVDNETGELVRQIPSEEMLSFIKRMQELDSKHKGAVIQDRA
jgi:flagellar protein FlaG